MTATLAGRGAVVTGGGRGIGAAVARALALASASVVVAARTVSEIERVAADLRQAGHARTWAVGCDVTDESEVRRLGEAARAHLGAVDVLVNVAGAGASAPLAKLTLADWNGMLAANATSAFLCMREFLSAMVERGFGRIVTVASIAGLEGGRYIAHYSASKHAVIGLTRSVALEVRGSGVTVNAVCPGYVATAMTERTLGNVEARAGLDRSQALAAVLASARQDRLLAPAEVADAVLALCLDPGGTSGEAVVISGASPA